jgi:cytochrome c biogenesis protein CcmG/thiol:disulfide interchange protein DsbE
METGEKSSTEIVEGDPGAVMMKEETLGIPESRSTPRGWGVFLVWFFVLALLGVIGWGLIRAQQGPVGVGQKVPDFELTTFDGGQINIEDLRGQVVVINFWASWCKPCEQEAAELEMAYQNYRDKGVAFLGVDYVDTEPQALAYLAKFDITYPNGPDLGTRISQAFRIRGVPETYIVGKDGDLVDVKIGPYTSYAEIENAIERAMNQ